ncbi:hypothetical protein [Limnoraphis robusta]|nr:hypothetical protein [Limnoraphis robusta]MEA5546853.1 hypothetical protein [Limnoraphis robusta CCNP1324]
MILNEVLNKLIPDWTGKGVRSHSRSSGEIFRSDRIEDNSPID